MPQAQSAATEDSLSFVSAIFGALGSTVTQENNPRTLLFGLVLAAFAKALPSIGQKPLGKETIEDWLMLLATFVGALAAGIQSNFSFSTPGSQEILVVGLLLGLLGKTIPSLIGNRRSLEDWVPLIAAIASAIAILPLGAQYATIGIFFGFLAKQLIPPSQSAS